MSYKVEAQGSGESTVATGSTTDDDTALNAQLLLRNDDPNPAELTVVRRFDGNTATSTVEVAPQSTYGFEIPSTVRPVIIEVYCTDTMAATSVRPGDRPPLFCYREGLVLVAHE